MKIGLPFLIATQKKAQQPYFRGLVSLCHGTEPLHQACTKYERGPRELFLWPVRDSSNCKNVAKAQLRTINLSFQNFFHITTK